LFDAVSLARWLYAVALAVDKNPGVIVNVGPAAFENREIDPAPNAPDLYGEFDGNLFGREAKFKDQTALYVLPDILFWSIAPHFLVNEINNLTNRHGCNQCALPLHRRPHQLFLTVV